MASALEGWFREKGRPLPWRQGAGPYRVLVSESMLQQTRIQTVLAYYPRFMERFPDLESLASASEEEVLKLWAGLGYYSRARNLWRTARIVVEEREGRLPEKAAELKKLPGIGDYMAGAIASIAFGEAAPAVDGNVMRILARFDGDERDVTDNTYRREAKNRLAALLKERPAPGLFNEALMELGEVICLPAGRPLCRHCPLKDNCQALAKGLETDLPLRGTPRPRRLEQKTVLLLGLPEESCVALVKRPEKGLLAGMYAFPLLDGALDPADIRPYLTSYGVKILSLESGPAARHIFTHVEWQMTSFKILTDRPLPDHLYAPAEKIGKDYALPSAFKYFLGELA